MNEFVPSRRPLQSRFDLTPFADFDLAPIEQWLNTFFAENGRFPSALETRVLPRADVAETDKELIVTLELPGTEDNDVNVRIVGNQLVVSGERKQKKEDKDKHYYRTETTYGAFERRFALPDDVRKDAESVKATSQRGILEIRIPKVEQRPAVKIPIKTL